MTRTARRNATNYSVNNAGSFVYVQARTVPVRVAQFGAANLDLRAISESMIANIEKDTFGLDRRGLYLLTLNDGFYIGETHDQTFYQRLRQHQDRFREKLRKVTIAYSTNENFETHDIRDMESLLINAAEERGLDVKTDGSGDLKNKRRESRKIRNFANRFDNELLASFIWDMFMAMNVNDLLEIYRASKLPDDEAPKELVTATEKVGMPSFAPKPRRRRGITFAPDKYANKDISTRRISSSTIFEHVPRRDTVSSSYDVRRGVFINETAVQALFDYLYEGEPSQAIERKFSLTGKSSNGWVMGATLAYYRIETNGDALGKLALAKLAPDQARLLIEKLVADNP